MSEQQFFYAICALLGLLISICGFFIGRLIAKLDDLAKSFGDYQTFVERNFINIETFETNRKEMRANINDNIFPALTNIQNQLAALNAKGDIASAIADAIRTIGKRRG